MNTETKSQILELRAANYSYKEICEYLHVKPHMVRNAISRQDTPDNKTHRLKWYFEHNYIYEPQLV